MLCHNPLVLPGKVQEPPQRHVRRVSTLMLVEIQLIRNDKGQIVLHLHKDRILQGHNLQIIRIAVSTPAYRIVQFQQILFIPEQEAKQAILLFPVNTQSPPQKMLLIPF